MPIHVILSLFLFGADFPICDTIQDQQMPDVICVNDTFIVFWNDKRFYDAETVCAVFAARVLPSGLVLDPDGKEIYCDTSAGKSAASFDGSNLLVVIPGGNST